MDPIKDLWFDANRIYMKTDGGETFSRPLEAFPLLKDASDRERLDFKIGKFGDDVRRESLDEDIHISSFFDTAEPDYDQGKYTDNLFLVCFLSNQETSLKIAEYIFVLFIKLLSLPRFPRRYFRKEVREVGNINI